MNVFSRIWAAGSALADAMTRLANAFNAAAEQIEQRIPAAEEAPAVELNGKRTTRIAAKP